MTQTSTSLVSAVRPAPKPLTIPRKDVEMGEYFKVRGGSEEYMHTGRRTAPPSKAVPGDSIFGLDAKGRPVVAFSSVKVKGTVAPGEDGAMVSTDGFQAVEVLGRAGIRLSGFSEQEKQALVDQRTARCGRVAYSGFLL